MHASRSAPLAGAPGAVRAVRSVRAEGGPSVVAHAPALVHVCPDAPTRAFVAALAGAHGVHAAAVASVDELLATGLGDGPGCLVLDLPAAEPDARALLDGLHAAGCTRPVVFLARRPDAAARGGPAALVRAATRALRAGAVDVLPFPPDEGEFRDAVRRACAHDAATRAEREAVALLRRRLAALTAREHEVLVLVVQGLLNKQIAARVAVAERTVKAHRGRILAKMGATSLPQLVRMADRLGLCAPLHVAPVALVE